MKLKDGYFTHHFLNATVGGYIGERFFGVGVTGFNLMSFVVAVAGSLLVLFVGRLLMHS